MDFSAEGMEDLRIYYGAPESSIRKIL